MEGQKTIGSIIRHQEKDFLRERSQAEIVLLPMVPIFSAILLSSSFPPYNLSFLVWFCLAPFLYVLRRWNVYVAGALSLIFGYSFGLVSFSWLVSLDTVDYFHWLFLFLPIFSLYYLLFGMSYNLCSRNTGGWSILATPALWVALEYIRSNLFFLSCPGNLLGHTQYLHPIFIQVSDITGVYGISFLIMLSNQFISQIPQIVTDWSIKRRKSINKQLFNKTILWQLIFVSFCFIAIISYGYFSMFRKDSGESLKVALIQGNVLTRDNMPFKDQVKHLRVYEKLSMDAAKSGAELIVWPSSSLPAPINYSRLVSATLKKIAQETGAYLLVGGAGYEKFSTKKEGSLPFSNSEFLISPEGQLQGQYNKMKLLPFDEYLPLQGKFTWPRWITSLNESFMVGSEYTLFQAAGARFGAPICWENYFSDHYRRFVKKGANFMVSATNDAFFGKTAGSYQALGNNIFRAVENRVAVARVSSIGVTCFINPNGMIIDRVRDVNGKDLFIPGILVHDVPLYERKSFYTLYGDIFSYCAIAVSVLFILISLYFVKMKRHL